MQQPISQCLQQFFSRVLESLPHSEIKIAKSSKEWKTFCVLRLEFWVEFFLTKMYFQLFTAQSCIGSSNTLKIEMWPNQSWRRGGSKRSDWALKVRVALLHPKCWGKKVCSTSLLYDCLCSWKKYGLVLSFPVRLGDKMERGVVPNKQLVQLENPVTGSWLVYKMYLPARLFTE